MKQIVTVFALIFLAVGLIFGGCAKKQPAQQAQGETPQATPTAAATQEDFVALQKKFFEDLQAKKYQEVWDSLTKESKEAMAKALAGKSEGKLTTEQALEALDKDTDQARTKMFDELTSGDTLKEMLEKGTFTLKSSEPDKAVVTVVDQDKKSKDLSIIQEDGKWKYNVFADLEKGEHPAGKMDEKKGEHPSGEKKDEKKGEGEGK
ncbi:MAG: hypothetical protein HYU64_19005 [Armatimonadetes bacterium]|nr:hypothetical protein [Armatimonadota bacterium]